MFCFFKPYPVANMENLKLLMILKKAQTNILGLVHTRIKIQLLEVYHFFYVVFNLGSMLFKVPLLILMF